MKSITNYGHERSLLEDKSIVEPEYIEAPHTTIQNRAKIENAMLKPLMGVERVLFTSLTDTNEYGDNGQKVQQLDTKDSRIRFVGSWIQNSTNNRGAFISQLLNGDYVEVSYFGTGINILTTGTGLMPFTVTHDEDSPITVANISVSGILDQSNYAQHRIWNGIKTKTLGWHTVILESVSDNLNISGIEILNEESMQINAGVGFSGTNKQVLSELTSVDHKEGIVGINGGRAVKYLQNNTVKYATTEVGTPLFFDEADHSNEEIFRTIHWREFGRNKGDDFSTLTTSESDRAFTLDDNTTTLTCVSGTSNDHLGEENLLPNAAGNYFTITFVGTGLSLKMTYVDAHGGDIYVDGVLKTSNTAWAANQTIAHICSGLKYGSHTVKIVRSTNFYPRTIGFVIWQPKKPTLPANVVELADYCVLADFVANTVSGLETMSQGVVRKSFTREVALSGSWVLGAVAPASQICGSLIYTGTDGGYSEIVFIGTGFDFRYRAHTSYASSVQLTLDESITDFSSYTTSVYGGTFTAATGILNPSAADLQGSGLAISGLPFGIHKIKILRNAGGGNLIINAFDVITPIHVNNTSVGNLSLEDKRNLPEILSEGGEVDWSKAKAILLYDQVNNKILYSKNIKQVLDFGDGKNFVYFEKPFKNRDYISTAGSGNVHSTVGIYELSTGGQFDKKPESVYIACSYYNAAYTDQIYSVAFFGELQDEE